MNRAKEKKRLKKAIEKQSKLLSSHPMLITQKFISDLNKSREKIEKMLKDLEDRTSACYELLNKYADELG